jgi:hypothetical protein
LHCNVMIEEPPFAVATCQRLNTKET